MGGTKRDNSSGECIDDLPIKTKMPMRPRPAAEQPEAKGQKGKVIGQFGHVTISHLMNYQIEVIDFQVVQFFLEVHF